MGVPSYRVQRRVLSYQFSTQFDGLSPASIVDACGNSSGMMSLFFSKSSLMHSGVSSMLLSSEASSMSCMAAIYLGSPSFSPLTSCIAGNCGCGEVAGMVVVDTLHDVPSPKKHIILKQGEIMIFTLLQEIAWFPIGLGRLLGLDGLSETSCLPSAGDHLSVDGHSHNCNLWEGFK
ncbi:hypothetical protein HAX54_019864, partial [Datura stramonium]|nr:hypothetical protein [Datura stramonium]